MKNRKTYKIVERQTKNFKGEITEYAVTYDGESHVWFFTDQIKEAQKRLEEYNNTYYLSDYSEDEIQYFFNSINWNILTDAINEYLGMNLTYKVQARYKNDTITGFEIESNEDLTNLCPILGKAWKEFRVETFNNSISVVKNTGELYVWGTIIFGYNHLDGGSNGANLLSFTYHDSTKRFEIVTERDRYNLTLEREKRYAMQYGKDAE